MGGGRKKGMNPLFACVYDELGIPEEFTAKSVLVLRVPSLFVFWTSLGKANAVQMFPYMLRVV